MGIIHRLLPMACAGLAFAVVLALPSLAEAQYKNTEFGLDFGYWLSTKPSIVNSQGNPKQGANRPNRLPAGYRLGGETSFKMDEDHWWFLGRMNLALFLNSGGNPNCSPADPQCQNQIFDAAADTAVGDLLGLQLQIATRYVILTDKVRPYIQGGLSYMRLFSFAGNSDNDCIATFASTAEQAVLCNSGQSNFSNFVPHPNVWALHLQPGVEIVYSRDKAVNIFVDVQRWLIFNAEGNFAFVFGLGFNFFT